MRIMLLSSLREGSRSAPRARGKKCNPGLTERRIIPVMPLRFQMSARRSPRQQLSDVFEVGCGVNPGMRHCIGDGDNDSMAVPQGAQLLERLEMLERRRLQLRVACEKRGAIGI